MKKHLSVLLSLSLVMSPITMLGVHAEGEINYTDTAPKAVPANLITNVSNIDTGNSAATSSISGNIYTLTTTANTQGSANGGYFAPFILSTTVANASKHINLQHFEQGKTYVFAVKVRKASDDATLTPYFGSGISSLLQSNEYGTDGMAVTSTDWITFKSTITTPSDWDTATGWKNKLWFGLARTSDLDSKVEFDRNVGDSLYLAEEAAHELSVTAENGTAQLAKGGSMNVTAEVLDQVGLKGGLDQTVSCVVLSQDREEEIEGITASVSGNTVTLSCGDSVPAGTYTVVAISDTYDMVKGLEFDVVEDLSIKYADFVTPAKPTNLMSQGINTMRNVNGGHATNQNVTGGRRLTASNNIQTESYAVFAPVIQMANTSYTTWNPGDKTNNKPLDLEYFKAGTTYVYTAKVKSADTTKAAYYGIAIPHYQHSLSYYNAKGSNEYGKVGMAVTSADWMDFKATITFPENWINDGTSDSYGASGGQVIYMGLGTGSDVGAAVDINTTVDTSLYLAEETLYDISNEVVTGSTTLDPYSTVTLKSELTNQIGLKGGLSQSVSWVALSSDRKTVIDTIDITDNGDGTVTVCPTHYTAPGNYVIAAYSDTYHACKGINITVESLADIETFDFSQNNGDITLSASLENAKPSAVKFLIAAYSTETNGELRFVDCAFRDVTVTDGEASVTGMHLDGLTTGTVVKAYIWDNNLRPLLWENNTLTVE